MAETATLPTPATAAPAATPKPAAAPVTKPSTPAPAKAAAPTSLPELGKEGQEYDAKFSEAFGDKKPDAKPEGGDKAPEQGKEATKTPDPAADKAKEDRTFKGVPPEFRKQYETTKAEATALRQEKAQLEARIKEAEGKGKDATTMAERLTAIEAERNELQGTIRALKREKSPDFVEKFDKPYFQAQTIAKRSIERLMISDPNTGEMRKASFDNDFAPFYREALGQDGMINIDAIETRFGKAASIAVTHINDLLTKNDFRESALKDEEANWEAKMKEDSAKEAQTKVQREQQHKQYQEAKEKAFKSLVEEKPELYGEDPEDSEGNELLTKGMQFVAAVPKTPQEMVTYQATLFHKAAAFDRQTSRLEKTRADLKEALATIEEMKNSNPGKTRRDSDSPTHQKEGWEDEARRTVGNV